MNGGSSASSRSATRRPTNRDGRRTGPGERRTRRFTEVIGGARAALPEREIRSVVDNRTFVRGMTDGEAGTARRVPGVGAATASRGQRVHWLRSAVLRSPQRLRVV